MVIDPKSVVIESCAVATLFHTIEYFQGPAATTYQNTSHAIN